MFKQLVNSYIGVGFKFIKTDQTGCARKEIDLSAAFIRMGLHEKAVQKEH